MKELVIISGKGGTGKTSITASFAALAQERVVVADCDVDAPNLHYLLQPRNREEHEFTASVRAVVDSARCSHCGACVEHCRFAAISADPRVDPLACEGCGFCELVCPEGAVSMHPVPSGHWYSSDTRCGPMIHARLNVGEGNSGKLVSRVKEEARRLAERTDAQLVLVDGPPGTGCPVIASLSGASCVMVVTEPSVSGLHDLVRVLDLCRHFDVAAAVCVNRHDIHPESTRRIEAVCGGSVSGYIPHDPDVTRALMQGKTVVEFSRGPAAESLRRLWREMLDIME